ncbi:DUF86 domain-containing protein [Flavobacterium sp.]|jgi:uncharacterized protein with HEPN domain|uniref:HepT-like ribonuclease domain-containing protein n=1 Tax=Flavobacterium sp. TaxID=239 RepID=UPI003BE5BC51
MLDDSLKYTLQTILEHISKCEKRFSEIKLPEDFVSTEQGNLLLDAIVTRLQAIGENAKNIVKKHPELLENHPEIEWNKIIRFRDFISHHYDMLDYEIVFQICDTFLIKLRTAIEIELIKFNY